MTSAVTIRATHGVRVACTPTVDCTKHANIVRTAIHAVLYAFQKFASVTYAIDDIGNAVTTKNQ